MEPALFTLKIKVWLKYFYDLSTTGYSFERSLLPKLYHFIESKNTPETCVIDFGCGSKPYAFLFNKFKGTYKGIDVYPGPSVDLTYDGNQIPLISNSVDLVFSASVFEHVENLEISLKEIFRILKPRGSLIAVVPFISHLHSAPFDFHRPTQFGWASAIQKICPNIKVSVSPVDSRWNCITNLITSQINLTLLDIIRFFALTIRNDRSKNAVKRIETGDASPQGQSASFLRWIYILLKFNPINFSLGFLSFVINLVAIRRRSEGEITSGYLVVATKTEE